MLVGGPTGGQMLGVRQGSLCLAAFKNRRSVMEIRSKLWDRCSAGRVDRRAGVEGVDFAYQRQTNRGKRADIVHGDLDSVLYVTSSGAGGGRLL